MVNWDCGKNYYKILGVKKDASFDEIREKYRKLSRQYHPDLNPNADLDVMAEINEAYNIIGDRVIRNLYDKFCILDLEEEIHDNPYEGNNPFVDNENPEERKSFFGRLKNGFYYEGKSNFFNEELNNPYRDTSYNPEYQRVIDGKNTIYDNLDKEIHNLNAFENEIKEKKEEIILLYDYSKLIERLRLPFYNKALALTTKYGLDMTNDKKYLGLYDDVTINLFKVLYRLARLLECRTYCVLYDRTKKDEYDELIEKVDELYIAIFELIGMTTGEAFFIESYFSSKKSLTKQEKKIMNLKYEISRCYVSYKKLTDKYKNKKNKTLIKK